MVSIGKALCAHYTIVVVLLLAQESLAQRSTLKWLSFYNDCAWGGNFTAIDPSPKTSDLPVSGAIAGYAHVPTIQGPCATKGPTASTGSCWIDQLAAAGRHNASAMLLLQTAGPVFCGDTGCSGCLYICPNDCDDPSLRYPRPSVIDWRNGTHGPGAGTCGLAWVRRTLAWARTASWPRAAAAAPRVAGVMLGDELSGGMNLGNYTAVAAAVHAALNGTEHFVYTNEGTHQYGPAGWPSIPAGLDVISLDGYGVCEPPDAAAGFCGPANASEAAWHRAFYEARLYPKLLPHQRVAVVPGLFGCATPAQPGGCERNASYGTARCTCALDGADLSAEGQARHLVAKLDAFAAWAREDARLVGINPWHYANRPSSLLRWRAGGAPDGAFRNPSMDMGAVAYPEVVTRLLQLGWKNVTQFRPADACGLVATEPREDRTAPIPPPTNNSSTVGAAAVAAGLLGSDGRDTP